MNHVQGSLLLSVVVVKPFLSLCFAFAFVAVPRTAGGCSESRFPESFVMNSSAASPVNGLDESDNASSHKSVLGDESRWGAVVRHNLVCEHSQNL